MIKKILIPSIIVALYSSMSVAGDYHGLPPLKPLNATTSTASNETNTTNSSSVKSKNKSTYIVPSIKNSKDLTVKSSTSMVSLGSPEAKESIKTKNEAKQALIESEKFKRPLPVIGSGFSGQVNSFAGTPVMVCSPNHTCGIIFPNGTTPIGTVGIKKTEWTITQFMADKRPEIFVSPKFSGVHQNMIVVLNDNGQPVNYPIILVSDKSKYIPLLTIHNKTNIFHTWNSGIKAGGQKKKFKKVDLTNLPNVNITKLNRNFTITCGGGGWFSSSNCNEIKPVSVYSNNQYTFLKMPKHLQNYGNFPIVMTENPSGKKSIVNFQIKGNDYVITGIPYKIILRLGSEIVNIRNGDFK